ncbi:MAG: DUF6731 family protein [Thermodesulfobacteriota bacterium]|nr:DUF6731 family protein [Thermodesulfobacteriota bacterium]
MVKNIKVDFYRVKMPDNSNSSFQNIIDHVSGLPDDESRNVEMRGYPVRLKTTTLSRNIREGDIMRIRMDELPLKAKISGEVETLDFDDDEGLGEETAFYYNSNLRTLLLQRNKTGVSASAFSKYFEEKGGLEGSIVLEPILQADVIRRLAGMQIIRKMDIKFAGVDNFKVFRELDYGIGSVADLSQSFDSPSITLSIGMGRKKGSLNLENVLASVRSLIRFPNSNTDRIDKIEVKAKEDFEGNIEILNILEYRIVESLSVPLNDDRRVFYSDRQVALQQAWKNRQEELTRIFR